jgi:hypothetical protein
MSSSSRSCARSERAAGAARAAACLARRAFLALAVLALATAAAPAEKWAVLEDRWYELRLGGQRCGWFHETLERAGDTFRSSTETEMTVGRMGQGVTIRTASAFEETAAGVPLRASVRRDTGAAPVDSAWEFRAGELVVTESQGGRRTEQRRPLPPAGWLPPRAADEFVRARMAAGASEIRYVTLDPESGPDAVTIESSRGATSREPVDGRETEVTEWTSRNSLMERPTREWVAADGTLVRSATDLGVGILESRRSTRAEATARRAPVEVMARTFVPLAADARALSGARRAELAVSAKDGKLGDLPSSGAQRFERTGPGAGTVTVDAGRGSQATPAEAADARYAAASVVADAKDPEVVALAGRALRGVADEPAARAEALRAAVHRHLSDKNLASGFATASECVRSRAGDCTEHAVLLCALLRSQGIPARVASGLLYVPDAGEVRNSYGWHMWTQALVGGAWTDLDAVLPPGGPGFDASHLLTGTSPADGSALDAELVRIVDLMGDLAIEVRSVDGKAPAPAGKAP